MYEALDPKDFQDLQDDDKELLSRITAYSSKVLGDIDPQKVRISEQLEKLKPVMEELAKERGSSIEDIFMKYMDLASVLSAKKNEKFKSDMVDLGIL